MNALIVLSLVALTAVSTVTAQRCFVCNSQQDPRCGHHFRLGRHDLQYIQQCQTMSAAGTQFGGSSCIKVETAGGIVQRGCYNMMVGGGEHCSHNNWGIYGQGHGCICNTDICNGNENITAKPFFILLSALAALFLKYHATKL